MDISLSGKVAIITGASSGIGLAMVSEFLAAGSSVVGVFLPSEVPPESVAMQNSIWRAPSVSGG